MIKSTRGTNFMTESTGYDYYDFSKKDLDVAIRCIYEYSGLTIIFDEASRRYNGGKRFEDTIAFDVSSPKTWQDKSIAIAYRAINDNEYQKFVKQKYFSGENNVVTLEIKTKEENLLLAKKACKGDKVIYDKAISIIESDEGVEDVDNNIIPFDVKNPITWPCYILNEVKEMIPPHETEEEKEEREFLESYVKANLPMWRKEQQRLFDAMAGKKKT